MIANNIVGCSSGRLVSTVTGGTLTSDATYYYRTFTANGTLAVTGAALSADILVVGGGGSGGGGSYDAAHQNGASGTSGQGNAGGNAVVTGAGTGGANSGGGGGSSSVGGNGSNTGGTARRSTVAFASFRCRLLFSASTSLTNASPVCRSLR